MSSRRVIILFIAALLIIAGAVWLSSQRHLDRAVTAGQPVLPEMKKVLNEVTQVQLARADGTRTTLRKSGGDWIVTERDFAADAGRVRKLLLDVSALAVNEEKTSDPARYSTLSVEDVDVNAPPPPPLENKDAYDFNKPVAATRIDVTTPAKTWGVIIGKSSGAKSGYVRVTDAKQSFLASPRPDVETEPQRWLDHTIVDIPEARIQSVDVKPIKGSAYSVSRKKREDENFTVSNIPKGRKLSYEGVANSLASGLESVSLDDVQKKTEPVTAAGKTIEHTHATYRTFDGMTVEVDGRKESLPGLKKDDPKVEKFYIDLNASSKEKATEAEAHKLNARVTGREFEISSFKFEGMFKPMDDLLEAPATISKIEASVRSPASQ
jgi:hypothetical protein